MVYNPLDRISEPAVLAIETAAKALKMGIQRLAAAGPGDFDAVFLAMARQKVDAVTVLEDPMMHSQSFRIVESALKGRVPAVFGVEAFAAAGGLMSYGPNRPEL